ncbi:SRPBCC family protein [Mycobacteroides chelonae]|uniref:SRPBCC family protein n=1 Tax=Mycobacteroides chelonae TaxID=1774 RepID=UPI0018B0AE68|nr:SRPBCC family protein [Mycobacteroides chelonae]MBF9318862.1 SRPBCC family protein [Mycobacteroides chelonae]
MRFDAVPIPVDGVEEFFATAPFVTRVRRTFDAPPEDVWRVVSGDRMWSWLPSVWGCRYPQDITPTAGTVRDFQMYIHSWMVFAQHEQIIHLDAPHVMRYTALDATLPVFGSWCEEYRVLPESDPGKATVDWTLACAPRYLTNIPGSRIAIRPVAAILKPIFWFGLGGLARELPVRGPQRTG